MQTKTLEQTYESAPSLPAEREKGLARLSSTATQLWVPRAPPCSQARNEEHSFVSPSANLVIQWNGQVEEVIS